MPATKGQTDSTLKIPLTPYLLQVGFGSQIVAQGGSIAVEAQTLNVADGAKIQITLLDGQGGSVGTAKGEIFSGIYRGMFLVEKANSTGLMLAVAELADYGLKLSGPACKVLPPIKIENLKWMDAEGKAELETVIRGEKVMLTADVTLGPMDGEIDFKIVAHPAAKSGPAAKDGKHSHAQEAQPQAFKYHGKIKSKKISEVFKPDWDVKSRKAKLDYTINLYGVTSKPSKKVNYQGVAFDFSE